jgi:hypothetical protein
MITRGLADRQLAFVTHPGKQYPEVEKVITTLDPYYLFLVSYFLFVFLFLDQSNVQQK